MKYDIKPLGLTKTRFSPKALRVWFVFTPVKITHALQRFDIELKSILENPTDF